MQAIQNWFQVFSDSILSIFNFFIALFKDFFDVLELLTKVPEIVGVSLSWLPDEVLIIAMVLIGVVIAYKVLGREG